MNRLRAYRFIEGKSQEELAHLLGVSTQQVSAIESGRRPPNVNLTILGYLPDRLQLPNMSQPLHRQRASTKASSTRRAQELLRLGGEVFKELQETTSNAPRLALHPLHTPATIAEFEDAAVEVRQILKLEPEGPINNLTVVLERAGICIVPIAQLEGIDGISSWVDGIPVIGLSPNIPGDRFRLTLGHELGHLLFHTKESKTTEKEAFRFGSALLFPHDEFVQALPRYPHLRDFVSLKSSWGVAASALVYRAHELGLLDDQRYRSLQIQMSKWRRSEPGGFEPAYPQLLPKLLETNGGVSVVATNLGFNQTHLAELINWKRLRVA